MIHKSSTFSYHLTVIQHEKKFELAVSDDLEEEQRGQSESAAKHKSSSTSIYPFPSSNGNPLIPACPSL